MFLTTGLASLWLFQTDTHRPHPVSVEVPPDIVPTPVAAIPKNELQEQFFDCVDRDDELFYEGYEVRRITETIMDEFTDRPMDVSYVVVKRHGKTIAKFDGVYYSMGNSAEFGLCNLLGDKARQLVIALTIPRGGRHWIVSLYPEFRVLFDSYDYGVGRELEDSSAVDIDKDGVFEISLPKVSFYGLKGLQSVSETPLTEIVFKYDAKRMKYLPANHLFVDHALRTWNSDEEKDSYQYHRFNYLLDHVFAGKEKEGWASFNEHCPAEDKEQMRARIKAILRNDPVYKYIYQKNSSSAPAGRVEEAQLPEPQDPNKEFHE
jgi:hypothetical protein